MHSMVNVVAPLQQRCGNGLATFYNDVVPTSEIDAITTLLFDRVTKL